MQLLVFNVQLKNRDVEKYNPPTKFFSLAHRFLTLCIRESLLYVLRLIRANYENHHCEMSTEGKSSWRGAPG